MPDRVGIEEPRYLSTSMTAERLARCIGERCMATLIALEAGARGRWCGLRRVWITAAAGGAAARRPAPQVLRAQPRARGCDMAFSTGARAATCRAVLARLDSVTPWHGTLATAIVDTIANLTDGDDVASNARAGVAVLRLFARFSLAGAPLSRSCFVASARLCYATRLAPYSWLQYYRLFNARRPDWADEALFRALDAAVARERGVGDSADATMVVDAIAARVWTVDATAFAAFMRASMDVWFCGVPRGAATTAHLVSLVHFWHLRLREFATPARFRLCMRDMVNVCLSYARRLDATGVRRAILTYLDAADARRIVDSRACDLDACVLHEDVAGWRWHGARRAWIVAFAAP